MIDFAECLIVISVNVFFVKTVYQDGIAHVWTFSFNYGLRGKYLACLHSMFYANSSNGALPAVDGIGGGERQGVVGELAHIGLYVANIENRVAFGKVLWVASIVDHKHTVVGGRC